MDFPNRSMLEGLSEAEYEALAAFDDAVGDLTHEWESAKATSGRLMRMLDAAERRIDNGTTPLPLHFEAVDEALTSAVAFATDLERVLWRYTAAYTATGLSILDRLTDGRPPLSEPELELLRGEPSVGRLQELLEVPLEHRYAARMSSGGPSELKQYREERTLLLQSVEAVYVNLTAREGERRWTRQAVAVERLSKMDDGEHDEPWSNLIVPLLHLAMQTPYEISTHLNRLPAPAGR
ncbi:hypothetical protein ACFXKJ_27090 [Kitasatospora indigofera]|uniref:hypothetical protein n=1 Tax=Kitasatospora indigofera TaxID=67307 RepID=UPI0036C3DBB6